MSTTSVTMTEDEIRRGAILLPELINLVYRADPAQKDGAKLDKRFKAGTFLLTYANGCLTSIEYEMTAKTAL